MALPNGDLITTVFDPQMAYPVDKRMQVDTLNSRDSMSMFIRWEGMEVYVLENKTKYILQGGRSNDFWKETGTGTGTGGTTFVGQFESADLLPTSGRSAGDYAFVGTGDDFVQYNWDNISGQWVMAEGQTDMASEFFHIGYKTPLRRPVIFPLLPKDVLVETSGDFVFAPETAVARFIFTGEVTAIRGIETAAEDREIKLVNRTGSDIPLRDKASGIPSGSGMDFGGTDYVWVNGSEITLKGNGTYWQLAPNNQMAFSDHLDSVNAQVSVGSDGLEVWTGFVDNITKVPVTFKELSYIPSYTDGRIFRQINSKYFGDAEFLERREFNILKFGGDRTGANTSDDALDKIKSLIEDGDIIKLPLGTYRFANKHTINKSFTLDAGNSTIIADGSDWLVAEGPLKSTHSVTDDYVWNAPSLTLNNTTGIAVGDLINIISSELFSPSRDYNYKGGNFLVTRIEGNVVTFAGAMPMDMSAASIVVRIYKPLTVKISNIFRLTNSGSVSNTEYGIRLVHCSNSEINGTNVDNFKFSIDVYRCVNVSINHATTGRARLSGTSYLSYGIMLQSSTNITLNNVQTDSGKHGVTNGGREVSYNFVFNNVVFKSEEDTHGWGSHTNMYDMTFNSCEFFGCTMTGRITFNQCKFHKVTGEVIGNMGRSIDPRYTQYIFNDCDLPRGEWFRIGTEGAQIYVEEMKYIGGIIFNDTDNAYIRLQQKSTRPSGSTRVAEITKIEFNNCKGVNVYSEDIIKEIVITNSTYNYTTDPMIQQIEVDSSYEKIGRIKVSNTGFFGRSATLLLNDVDQLELDGIYLDPLAPSHTTAGFELTNIGKLNILNSDMTGWARGFTVIQNIVSFFSLNSRLKFYTDNFYKNFLRDTPNFSVKNVELLEPVTGQLLLDNVTTKSGIKYLNDGLDTYRYDHPNWFRLFTIFDRPARNYTFNADYLNRYISFTYGDGASTSTTVPAGVFSAGDELVGEIGGDARTFVAGDGMTLRYPDGQGLVAPTGSRFLIKFKSANDALVTIIKPYTSTVPNASTTERGIIEQATDDEIKTGTDTERSVDPKGLKDNYVSFTERTINSTGAVAIAPLTYNIKEEKVTFTGSGAVTLNGFNASVTDRTLILINKTGSDMTISAGAGVPVPFAAAFTIPNNQSARFQVSSNLIIKEL